MTHDELVEWQAFDQVDPIGGYRGDLQAAMVAMFTVKNPEAKITDFLVVDPEPMTPEQLERREEQIQREKLEQSTARMAAMFEKDKKE